MGAGDADTLLLTGATLADDTAAAQSASSLTYADALAKVAGIDAASTEAASDGKTSTALLMSAAAAPSGAESSQQLQTTDAVTNRGVSKRQQMKQMRSFKVINQEVAQAAAGSQLTEQPSAFSAESSTGGMAAAAAAAATPASQNTPKVSKPAHANVESKRKRPLEDYLESRDPSSLIAKTDTGGEFDFPPPSNQDIGAPDALHFPRSCYSCKVRFYKLHHYYDQLCPTCAALNWAKRNQSCDLRGRVCLLTGARVKIGYACALKILRAGATLIATSRFPHDSAQRFAKETDFEQWRDRLHIYGLDLRDLRSVVRFTDVIAKRFPRLDAIINNAAQTVRRPPSYYRHLMPLELVSKAQLPAPLQSMLEEDPHVDGAALPSHLRLCAAPSVTGHNATSHPHGHTASSVSIEEVDDDADGSSPSAAGVGYTVSEATEDHRRGNEIISHVMNTLNDPSSQPVGHMSAGKRALSPCVPHCLRPVRFNQSQLMYACCLMTIVGLSAISSPARIG